MANFNKVILVGRLTADPELKQTQGGNLVTSFSIAVNRKVGKDAEKKADFFNIVAWRNTAEFICRHFAKGRAIIVCGRLENRSWTDDQNVKHMVTEIVAEEVDFADSKTDGSVSSAPASAATESYMPQAYMPNPTQMQMPTFVEPNAGDEGLPF
jgi:single-strand DNA-binding protein